MLKPNIIYCISWNRNGPAAASSIYNQSKRTNREKIKEREREIVGCEPKCETLNLSLVLWIRNCVCSLLTVSFLWKEYEKSFFGCKNNAIPFCYGINFRCPNEKTTLYVLCLSFFFLLSLSVWWVNTRRGTKEPPSHKRWE